jgi:C4-dicarboxylate transporter DctM subunit
MHRILVNAAVLTGVVCVLVGAATCFSWVLAVNQVPLWLADLITGAPGGKATFLLCAIAVFLVFGMVLDGLPAILIFFPIFHPIATAAGIGSLHFGVLVIAVVGIAIVTPPVGLCLVILSSLAGIRLTESVRPMMPYLAVLVLDLVVIAFWPWLVTVLPALFRL